MAALCCCPLLRHKKRAHNDDDAGQHQEPHRLPARPPPVRLPPPAPNGLDLSPQSTAARSSLTNPLPGAEADASVHLAELIIEDSDDDNGDHGQAHTSTNRSASTLAAVKARLRRHVSQDSISRLGESEEQIARRAEVKRLMRKRIREELQSDGGPVHSKDSALQYPAPPSVASFSGLGNGPRDTIEFAVDEITQEKELARVNAAHLSSSKEYDDEDILSDPSKQPPTRSIGKENVGPYSRPTSLCDLSEHDRKAAQSDTHIHARQRSSLPEIPASPQLQPVRAASLRDAMSLASWRLSFSADKLADLLTPAKSQSIFRPVVSPTGSYDAHDAQLMDHEPPRPMRSKYSTLTVRTANSADSLSPSQISLRSNHRRGQIPNSSSLVRDESPVGLWLRSQSQHFRLSTASLAQSEHHSEDTPVGHSQGSPAGQLCISSDLRSQLDSAILSQDSLSAVCRPRASSDAIRELSPPSTPLPALGHGASQGATIVEPGKPSQVVVRRGFAGIRLPSFRCEFV